MSDHLLAFNGSLYVPWDERPGSGVLVPVDMVDYEYQPEYVAMEWLQQGRDAHRWSQLYMGSFVDTKTPLGQDGRGGFYPDRCRTVV